MHCSKTSTITPNCCAKTMKSELRLRIAHRRNQSIVSDCYVTSPLKILALPHEQGHALSLMQMSASPGLLDSDEQNIELTLEENTRLRIFTQAYQRVFATHNHAQQNTTLHLKANSQLIYTPHPLVLHDGAHLKLCNTIYLENDARMVWSEIITCGRKQCGESFAFKQLSSLTRIYWNNTLILRDNLQWQPSTQAMDSPVHMAEFSHQATLYFADTHADFVAKIQLDALYQKLSTLNSKDIYFGVSQTHPKLIIVRILAQQGELLHEMIRDLSKQLSPP